MPVRVISILLLLCTAGVLQAQTNRPYSNLRLALLDPTLPIQFLDSLTVVPPLGIAVDWDTGALLDSSLFSLQLSTSTHQQFNTSSHQQFNASSHQQFNASTHQQILLDTAALKKKHPQCRRIALQYRVLPFNLSAKTFRLDTLAIRRRVRTDAVEFDYTPYEAKKAPWETAGLQSVGAYTRGLSFGSSQNLVFNSNLNLQLDGKLGNDLELRAAISDNSIPLQPDGSTRQIQEFDRIFIQLKRKKTVLTAGDYDLTRPNGYFSQYFKRLQGAMVESSAGFARDTLRLRAAAAVTKGKFARQIITGQEGNQGPYRLQGTEGERFIIVLAGTEKVYIDGQLQQRGLEDDYVVDYNLGEISFTPRRRITKDSRIIVEFEYAVQSYLRSTLAVNADWRAPRWNAWFNVFSEQDARNNGGAQDLSAAERGSLAGAGDQLRDAYASGIDTLTAFDPDRVLYRLLDTIICNTHTSILIYSTHADSARYAARFTEVAAGQGNYVLATAAANGRVFRWSPPDPITCRPTGNFEPIVRLVAPELRQLWTMGADLQPFKNAAVKAELALSNRDYNRFSPLDAGDDFGGAGYLQWRQRLRLGAGAAPSWKAELSAQYELADKNFQPLNPYRPAEFTRDWNTEQQKDTASEQIARAGFLLENGSKARLQYEFGALQRGNVYDGKRHSAMLGLRKNGWELQTSLNSLKTDGIVENSRFERPKAELSKMFYRRDSIGRKPLFKIGFYAEREKNARKQSTADTLNGLSFRYDLMRLYFQLPEQKGPWQLAGFVSQRYDFAPKAEGFEKSSDAAEVNLNGNWNNAAAKKTFNQSFGWVFNVRRLSVAIPRPGALQNQNSYLGKADYSLSGLRNALTLNCNYELGSGQSPKLEFNYVAVNPGEGLYTWIDRNRDSVLQVDEMELAAFKDQANYLRVAVTTPEYVRTDNVAFNPSLRFEPRMLWPQTKLRWKKTLRRAGMQSSLQISRRTFAGAGGIQTWNPFQLGNLADSALITLNTGWRNALFFNRGDPKWDAGFTHTDNGSRLAVTTGFEQRRSRELALTGRLNLSKRWSLESDITQSLKTSDHQLFNNRDFDIRALAAGPKLGWLIRRNLRLSSSLRWKNSRNTLGEKEIAQQFNWDTELIWNPSTQAGAGASVRAKATLADIRYKGQANSAVAFTMLEGLQNGKNYLWNIFFDREISKTVQLSLQYEGRKTGEGRTVHVGRAQVRARF